MLDFDLNWKTGAYGRAIRQTWCQMHALLSDGKKRKLYFLNIDTKDMLEIGEGVYIQNDYALPGNRVVFISRDRTLTMNEYFPETKEKFKEICREKLAGSGNGLNLADSPDGQFVMAHCQHKMFMFEVLEDGLQEISSMTTLDDICMP